MMVGGWYVQLAAIWHWFAIMDLYVLISKIVCGHSFFIHFFNLVSIS